MTSELLANIIPPSARNICRVCSSKADYDVFDSIPAFLHASPNDYLYWKKDISTLLEETTGLSIYPDDGLPRKMCAVCISYLKHASTFRQQVIDNTLSLKAVQAVLHDRTNDWQNSGPIKTCQGFKHSDKYGPDLTANDLIFNNTRKTDTNSLVNNVFNSCTTKNNDYMNKFLVYNKTNSNDQSNKCDVNTDRNLNSYLNLLFDRKAETAPRNTKTSKMKKINSSLFEQTDSPGEEIQTASSDDNEALDKPDIFSYKEKNFIEDDVMSFDYIKDANIIINIPEHVQERKCPACFRRFMFENSYKDHMNSCLEFKFLILIENLNRLSNFRKERVISPHEFIRRIIFCLKGMCQYLTECCGEEMSIPDLLVNGEIKVIVPSETNSTDLIGTRLNLFAEDDKESRTSEPDPLLNLLRENADPTFLRYMCDSPGRLSRTTDSASNSRSPPSNNTKPDSTNSDSSASTVNTDENVTIRSNPTGRKSLLESFNKVANGCTSTPKLLSPVELPFGSIKMNFSARCNACDTIFESIGSLEEHNSKFHNNAKKSEDHNRIIAMFESRDNDAISVGGGYDGHEGGSTVNVSKIMIKCSNCDKIFPTIMHLDQHKIKCLSIKPPYTRFI